MEEDPIPLITETENSIDEQIMQLETENSILAEKVLLRESQIKQTSADLQDAYNRLIRQSQDECNFRLNEILNEPKKDFFSKSQIQLQSKIDNLRGNIDDEIKKIKKVEICVEASEKYVSLFENLTSTLSNSISTNLSKINELSINSINKSVQKLQEENNNNESINQYYQKKCLKLKKLEDKNSKLSNECDQLMSSKNEIRDRISQLSDAIVSMSQKISISIQNKELVQLEKQDFVVISIEPACQKRKMPVGNLLVLAPIHSLTRQMQGIQSGARFFPKKNNLY